MKHLYHEKQVTKFLDSLIKEFDLTFNQVPFIYVADGFLYSCLHKSSDGENKLEVVTTATSDGVTVAVHYDLYSSGSYNRGKLFDCSWDSLDRLSETRELLKKIA